MHAPLLLLILIFATLSQPAWGQAHVRYLAQPGYAGAWVAMANGLGQLGRFDEARQAMDRALRANPAMTPRHLAAQIRILAGGRQELAEKSLSGLRAAGLLD